MRELNRKILQQKGLIWKSITFVTIYL
jgi:hypothetical protein